MASAFQFLLKIENSTIPQHLPPTIEFMFLDIKKACGMGSERRTKPLSSVSVSALHPRPNLTLHTPLSRATVASLCVVFSLRVSGVQKNTCSVPCLWSKYSGYVLGVFVPWVWLPSTLHFGQLQRVLRASVGPTELTPKAIVHQSTCIQIPGVQECGWRTPQSRTSKYGYDAAHRYCSVSS